jgi:hypothetical protein
MAGKIEQNLTIEEIEVAKKILKKIQENVTNEEGKPFF